MRRGYFLTFYTPLLLVSGSHYAQCSDTVSCPLIIAPHPPRAHLIIVDCLS